MIQASGDGTNDDDIRASIDRAIEIADITIARMTKTDKEN
jgi:hypothetical protein